MSTLSNPALAHDPSVSDDVYLADEVVPRNSPLIRPVNVNLRPSPTPSLELPARADSPGSPPSPRCSGDSIAREPKRGSNLPNLGDAVLVSYLADGTRPDIAYHAGRSPLPSGTSEAETTASEEPVGDDSREAYTRHDDRKAERGRGSSFGQNFPNSGVRRSMSIDTSPPAEAGPEGRSEARTERRTGTVASAALQLPLLGSLQSLATSALAFGGHRAEISGDASHAPACLDMKRDRERAPTPNTASAPTPGLRPESVPLPPPTPTAPGQPCTTPEGGSRREGAFIERERETEREAHRDVDRDYDMEQDEPRQPMHHGAPSPFSSQSSSSYSHLSPLHSASLRSPTAMQRSLAGELPPIHMQAMASPRSESNGSHAHNPLPSIRELDLSVFNQAAPSPDGRHGPHSAFPHSPPAGIPRLSAMSHHGSPPPMSPNDPFRRGDLPSPAVHLSPGAMMSPYSAHHPSPHSNGCGPHASHRTRPSVDYSSSSATETPGSTGAGELIGGASPQGAMVSPASTTGGMGGPLDQPGPRTMSIDGLTTTMGAYVCQFPGCTALPFQTQYLLNSHANVHSSERPHYCPVKGCPRSEGGKGFKRKNEMIRHGLVHDSPGYVCPFCPDREHKYPRPDNLQRHVRVHHVDKDKDDAQLRDVLAQRPDGPNRGRRRRHGP